MGAMKPIDHGSDRGYQQHKYRASKGLPEGEPCEACVAAHNDASATIRVRRPNLIAKQSRWCVVIPGESLADTVVVGPYTSEKRALAGEVPTEFETPETATRWVVLAVGISVRSATVVGPFESSARAHDVAGLVQHTARRAQGMTRVRVVPLTHVPHRNGNGSYPEAAFARPVTPASRRANLVGAE